MKIEKTKKESKNYYSIKTKQHKIIALTQYERENYLTEVDSMGIYTEYSSMGNQFEILFHFSFILIFSHSFFYFFKQQFNTDTFCCFLLPSHWLLCLLWLTILLNLEEVGLFVCLFVFHKHNFVFILKHRCNQIFDWI